MRTITRKNIVSKEFERELYKEYQSMRIHVMIQHQ